LKTPAFDHCLRIFENWDKPDSAVRDELFFDTANFPDEIIIPFRRELNKLLGNKRKNTVRRRQVKTYIDELNRTSKIIEKYLNLNLISLYDENKKVILRFADNAGTETKFRVFEMVYVIYKKVFDEIQISCKLNDIPFLEICNEVGFPLNTIDTTITEEYQKERVSTLMKSSPVTEVQPKTKNKRGNTSQPEIIAIPETTNKTAMKSIKSLKFRDDLTENGFYTLKKVKDLDTAAIDKLTGFIFSNDLPYQIAMLDHLGFLEHIEKEYCTGRKDLYRILAGLLSCSNRLIQGNINALINSSNEDRDRYTSYCYKETVIKDYQELS
jgi:hypothetical protein